MCMDDKSTMRRVARAHRKQAQEAAAACGFSQDILEAVGKLTPPRVLAVYCAVGSEIDPSPLALVWPHNNLRLALPVCRLESEPMLFRHWCDGVSLGKDGIGMAVPPPTAEILIPDMVLVPLLAFDKSGGRLGRGGGHYDRTLAVLQLEHKALAIGVAYDAQEVDACPMEAHDRRLDMVVTPTRIFKFDGGAH